MTPLEALDKLHTMFIAYAPRNIREDKELNEDLFECIKSALIENLLNEESKKYIYKKLKVLEIIKKKGIDIQTLIWSNTVAEYNANARASIGYTQEEYELVVGVIL